MKKNQHILSVASELFYKNGIIATGVDTIVSEAKIAKMTLYNHFPSKDDIVLAYLNKRGEEWRSWFEDEVNRIASTPIDKIIAIFDVLDIWFKDPDFNGCAFLNTASEFKKVSQPFHKVSIEHKKQLYQYIMNLVQETGLQSYEEVADHLYFLMEGAIATELMFRKGDSAQKAKKSVITLISSYKA